LVRSECITGWKRRGLFAALLGCAATAAVPGPVRITHGNESGQGHVFTLGTSCYAYTAGHVLRAGASASVAMVDVAGYRAEGKVIAVDAKLDLGLIEVQGEATRNGKFCTSAASTPMFRVDAGLEQLRGAAPGVWLDRVSSPAGGLDRFELALRRGGQDPDHLELVPGDSKHEARRDRTPQKGDSGATVFISDRHTARTRYSADGEPAARAAGKVLGVLSSVEGNVARVVRSDRVHEFVFNALQPVGWSGIRVEPPSAVVVARQRDGFREPRYVDLPLHATVLDHIAFELDLGDQDTLVEAVSIGLAPSTRAAAARARAHSVRVFTSQFRPGDGAKWVSERCAADAGQPRRPADRAAASAVACTLKAARVARGLRVEILGDPTTVRRIAIRAGR
jgi:hypothetical protein